MAKQILVWTVLPNGADENTGAWRVSVVLAPRLTPESPADTHLSAFSTFRNWPALLATLKFSLQTEDGLIPLKPTTSPMPDSALWQRLFFPDTQGVAVDGFVYSDFSQKNLYSFSMRNVSAFLREHYSKVATESPGRHPTLLPFGASRNALGDMLQRLGCDAKGSQRFYRFFEKPPRGASDIFSPRAPRRNAVGADGRTSVPFPLRVLPVDWQAPGANNPYSNLMANFSTPAEYAFYQADRFYRRSMPDAAQQKMRRPDFANVPKPPGEPIFDFHRIVASLADYPALLRALGLVMDFEIPNESPLAQKIKHGGTSGQFSLVVQWGKAGSNANDRCPASSWRADAGRFSMHSRSQLLTGGMLDLRGATEAGTQPVVRSPFDVYTMDVDGSALKTVNFLLTAQNLIARSAGGQHQVTYTTGNEQPLATLRSTGIGVAAHDRAVIVATDAATATAKNASIASSAADAAKVVLHAEDVFRGWRIDVEAAGTWRSLHARVGDYQVAGQRFDCAPDEGYSKGPSTTAAPDKPEDQYLHESLFRWTGWSLSAPRPGRTIRAVEAEDGHLQHEQVTTVTDTAKTGNRVIVHFKALPQSLPVLRFGQSYRLRARVVDLAGNSLRLADAGLAPGKEATAPVVYRRLEAIDPPALVPRNRYSEGESLERMVIRSNFDRNSSDYIKSEVFMRAVAQPASSDFEYHDLCQRHFVPPKTSQTLAETHGVFDKAFSGQASPNLIKKMYGIAQREEGTLFDALPGTQIELVTPRQAEGVATATSLPLAKPGAEEPTGDRMTGGQYLVHREALLPTPYLSDVPAMGVSLWGVPGLRDEGELEGGLRIVRAPDEQLVLLVPYAGQWPEVTGFRLDIQEREEKLPVADCQIDFGDAGMPTWRESEQERVLTIFLAKGQVARMHYASWPDEKRLEEFAMPFWVDASQRARFIAWARLGRHWMVSPFRSLVAVHATQAPVCAPMVFLEALRNPGENSTRLQGRVNLHRRSSGQFDLSADWQEWVDDPKSDAPVRIKASAQLAPVKLAELGPNTLSLSDAVDAAAEEGAGAQARGDTHDFGDAKFRLVQYQPRATTRFHEYHPPALHQQPTLLSRMGEVGNNLPFSEPTTPGAAVLPVNASTFRGVVIPASVRPTAPVVSHCVPSFEWSRGGSNLQRWSLRQGNALRVFLERPWFSSGDGELLGVLVKHNVDFEQLAQEKTVRYTEWGADPLWEANSPAVQATLSAFPESVCTSPVPVSLPDGGQAHVAGHRVSWDETRKKWRCDIVLNVGHGYTPFVRLALARYQPNALVNCEVSAQVIAEFAQLMPARGANLTLSGNTLRVQFYGEAMRKGPLESHYAEHDLNRVELVLQMHDAAIPGELGWKDASTLVDSLVNPTPTTFAANVQAWMVGGVLWEGTVTLPAMSGDDWRLMLREFERYPSDDVVDTLGIRLRQKMVIGERLVYADTFSFV